MNVEKALEEIEKEYSEKKETIKLISVFAREVDFISKKNVFFKERTYFENMELLHLLTKEYGQYTLSEYYMNGACLSLVYNFDGFNAHLFCIDSYYALEKISGGKCRIESNAKKISRVVCDLEGS